MGRTDSHGRTIPQYDVIMIRTIAPVVLLAGALWSTNGCGSSASGKVAWDPHALDLACRLVTQQEAATALGHDTTKGVPKASNVGSSSDPPDYHACGFGDQDNGVVVGVNTNPNAVATYANTTRDELGANSRLHRLDGIGEAGVIEAGVFDQPECIVSFKKGAAVFEASVTLNGRDQAAVCTLLTTLARTAAARMPD